MIRIILAVVAGYFAMAFTIFLLFSAAYLGMGTERAFQPGSYETSLLWCLVSLLLAVPAALMGGYICAWIGRSFKAVKGLAGLVVVLGIVAAAMTLMAPAPEGKRDGSVANLQAMSKAVTPLWVALINPLIGVAGVVVGGRLKFRAAPASGHTVAAAHVDLPVGGGSL